MTRLHVVFAAITIAAVPVAGRAAVRMAVDFSADGRCLVAIGGGSVEANVAAAAPDFRCTIPAGRTGEAVDLTVRLPPGADRAGQPFPQLEWRQQDGRWVGTATVPA